jgi:hypothetical protein
VHIRRSLVLAGEPRMVVVGELGAVLSPIVELVGDALSSYLAALLCIVCW